MKRTLLLFVIFTGLLIGSSAQSWVQFTSSDLEIPNAETIMKHSGDWYTGTAGGVFKSTNNGTSWTLVNNNLYSVFNRLRVEGFVSSGTNLVGVNRWGGVVVTTNGSSWTKATGLPINLFVSQNIVKIGSRLFIVVYDGDIASSAYFIFYSDNDGTSWIKGDEVGGIYSSPNIFSDGTTAYITHDNSSDNDEFLGTTTTGLDYSTNGIPSNLPVNSIENMFVSSNTMIISGEGGIYRSDPSDYSTWTDLGGAFPPGIAFIALEANETGKLYASVFRTDMTTLGFYSSDDLGDSWTTLAPTLTTGVSFANAMYATGNELMTMFIDDGMHYSSDGGANITKANSGLLATDFEEIFISGDNFLTSLFISGTLGSDDDGSNWMQWNTGLPTDDFIKRTYGYVSDGTSLFVNYSTNPDDDPLPEKSFKSIDDGKNWSEISAPSPSTNFKIPGVNGSVLFGMATEPSEAFYSSSNGGTNWTSISIPAGLTPKVVTGDGTTAFLGGFNASDKLEVYISSDNGASGWTLAMTGITTANLESYNNDDDVLLIAAPTGEVFLIVKYTGWDNRLLKWNGTSWDEQTANGIPYLDLETMAYHNGVLFASPWGDGVYISYDNGANFITTTGLPDGLEANDFAFKDGVAYIATARSIWNLTIPTDINEQSTVVSKLLAPNPAFNMVTVSAKASLVNVYSVTGQIVKQVKITNNQFSVSDLERGMYIVTVETPNGIQKSKLIVK